MRPGRRPVWTPAASVSVLRLGVLIGGLVIIVDLLSVLLTRNSVNPDDVAFVDQIDQLANYLLFSLLGILVVRDTGLMYAGVIAGVFASLLDAIVVSAASVMTPTVASPTSSATSPTDLVEGVFLTNLVIGTVFAGISGFVYSVMRRWSGGRRAR